MTIEDVIIFKSANTQILNVLATIEEEPTDEGIKHSISSRILELDLIAPSVEDMEKLDPILKRLYMAAVRYSQDVYGITLPENIVFNIKFEDPSES